MKQNKQQAATVAQGIINYLKKDDLLYLLPEVIEQLKQANLIAINSARVESAVSLDDNDRKQIAKLLEMKFGWKGEIEFETKPEIIGGLKILLGDKVLDLSVKNKLENIYEQI